MYVYDHMDDEYLPLSPVEAVQQEECYLTIVVNVKAPTMHHIQREQQFFEMTFQSLLKNSLKWL